MFSTKLISRMMAVLAVSLTGAFASAETVCRDLWTVKTVKGDQALPLALEEKEEQGPACDLVVESFQYNETDASVALKVRPVTYCPLDAIGHRKAYFLWVLPFHLRSSAELRLIVNDRETGTLKMERTSAAFEGGCK